VSSQSDDRANQVGGHAETEKAIRAQRCLLAVVAASAMHEQFVGNINKSQRADQHEQQIPESSDSAGLRVESMEPPS